MHEHLCLRVAALIVLYYYFKVSLSSSSSQPAALKSHVEYIKLQNHSELGTGETSGK